jgi:hypothetical protein
MRDKQGFFMPIKFRCVHCNQKLGIAHRKAGTRVQCPTCLKMVMVPVPEGEPASGVHPASPPPAAPAPLLFEQGDIDELIKLQAPEQPAPAAPPDGPGRAWSVALPAHYDVEPVGANGHGRAALAPGGILLTPGRATVLVIMVVLLVGAAFGAGLLVGRFL